ncbi:hypothetical protein EDD85DRAFT_1024760 [Armillaria nabsnona]|nr:hypothetical protein EDD85DRAFT_1024760 [Armillaria nabsnona]
MLLHRNLLANEQPPSSPPSSLPDLSNEHLLKILAALPNTVEVILTLAATCRRLNEFAIAYHFGSISGYYLFGSSPIRPASQKCRRTQRRPFTSFRMLRLSFIYDPPLSVIHCIFSDNFHKDMREVKRSLPALKRMGLLSGTFSVSFEYVNWLKVTLFECPGQYLAWTLRSIEESPVETLNLGSISDDVLLKFNEFPLGNLQNMTLSRCSFSFAAFSVFLGFHPHITTLHLGTWNPISRIAGRRGPRRSDHPKITLESATRMSLACISGTATTLYALLSTAEVFPILQSVTITGEDTKLGIQEALLLISQIDTIDCISIQRKGLNAAEWPRFRFPWWRGLGVTRTEALLTEITDFSISFQFPDAAEVPAAVALIPNLKRFRTTCRSARRKRYSVLWER